MINQQLIDYIKKQLELGQGEESIVNALSVSGWSAEDIKEAFAIIKNAGDQSVPMSVPPVSNSVLPGAVSLLKESLSLYKQRWKTFWGIILVPSFIVVFSSWAIGRLYGVVDLDPVVTMVKLILIAIICILNGVISIWSQTSLLYSIKDSPERIGVIDSYRRGWGKILPFFWVNLLMGLVVFGGSLLLIVPGVIFSISLSLVTFILIGENVGGLSALLKSREYVRGKWWDVLWRSIFIGLVSLIPYLVLAGILVILKPLSVSLAEEIVNCIALVTLAPIITTYSFLVYQGLRDSKSGVVFVPKKKDRVVFSLIAVFGILAIISLSIVLLSILFRKPGADVFPPVLQNSVIGIDPRSKARDAIRQADLHQIASAMEMYYGDNGRYLTQAGMPMAIGAYFRLLPKDPKTEKTYNWVDNSADNQKFCVYAELEDRKNCSEKRYYSASHKGNYEVCDADKWTLNCP